MVLRSPVEIRAATEVDVAPIAALHAASWRAHYRGAFSDAYLDGPIDAERLAVWTQRLNHPREGQRVLLAIEDARVIGFVCVFLDHDRAFGTLVDNLHVAVDYKGGGVGRALMAAAGDAMLFALLRRPVYLFALDVNHAAQGFYKRIGGTPAGQERKIEPDGSNLLAIRYVWGSPEALVEGASRRPDVSS